MNISDDGMNLALLFMEQNAKDSAYITNQLLDAYKNERDDAQATVKAIRARIALLVSGDYMPTTDALIRALYPTQEVIDAYRQYAG